MDPTSGHPSRPIVLVTKSQLQKLATTERQLRKSTASAILHESVKQSAGSWDVFLSHSSMDAELVLGAKALLEKFGFSVYVDWIDDPQLIRSSVNKVSASAIRARMRSCTMMLYAHTLNSAVSKWCPWELGYFDGRKSGNVFILPISTDVRSSFKGQEYLELYPYVDEEQNKAGVNHLWMNYYDDRDSAMLENAKTGTYSL